MVARVRTVAFQGIDVLPVDVEVQIANGVPAFNIVRPIATLMWREANPHRDGHSAETKRRPLVEARPLTKARER
jgi:hypothetical protein